MLKIAYQGTVGAYSEDAAIDYFGKNISLLPCISFDEVFKRVNEKECDRGIIPVENTLGGSIHRNYDLLGRNHLCIIGEKIFPVHHHLLANPDVRKENIKKVISHPQALSQCEHYLEKLNVSTGAWFDTAGAAKWVHDNKALDHAAIASKRAALQYQLNVLDSNIEDDDNNFTRFLIISKKTKKTQSDYIKTSLVFSLQSGDKRPGCLYQALAIFAEHNLNLTKIESRPHPGTVFEYLFYLDFEGDIANANCQQALNELKELASSVVVFGSYDADRFQN